MRGFVSPRRSQLSMSKPSLVRTLSKKFGKKDEAGNDAEEKPAEEKVLARTLSSRFSKQSKTEDAGGEREEKPLKRTLSNKFFGKKDEKTGEDAPEEEKKEGKVLKRTMSNKLFGKKDAASGEDVGDESGGGKPVLSRTSSQRFKKEEKKKLKARFDIRVVRISKCQINNTTVFLGWKRPPGTLGGDTKRAVVTDCCATFGDTISVEAVLSLPPGEEKFKPALILFELKEDKLVRKGAGKAKWHVLGRGQVDLAEYSKANKALCIIPLQKKKANIQLELEVTAVWQHFDGQRFEQMSAASLSAKQPEVVPGAKQKKVEVIGSAKYAVASDSEVDMYTEEDVDLNLSEIASDDDEEDYRSAFAESSNPFERAEEERMAPSSMAAMLSGLAGPPKKQQHESGEKSGEENLKSEEPPRPARAPPKKEAEDPPTPKREPPKMIEERKAAEQPAKQVVTAVVDDSNPFGPPKAVPVAAVEAKPSVPVATTTANTPLAATGSLTTCHDCKRENKNGWRFCDTCGARSKVGGAAEPEKKVEAKPAPSVPAVAAKKEEPAKIERVKKEVVEEEPRGPAVASAATGAMDDLRTLVDQQRREIQALKDNERRFANTIAMAERKVLAAESQLQMKERELKRLAVVASAGGGGGSEGGDSSELMTQVTELEAELMAERRRREFGTMMENLVFLSTFAFTREKESVAALKMFDELIRLSVFDESQAASSAQLVDHLCHTIMMMCQNVRTPQETAQYWVVTAVHLLKLLREGKKRLRSEVNEDHPLAHFERSLCKLATNLYTRLFTFMLRKIESLLIRSLGTPYQSEAYFRPVS